MTTAQESSNIPAGWSEDELRQIAEFYDSLTEEERIAHEEAAYEREGYTHLTIPTELVGAVIRISDAAELERLSVCDRNPAPTASQQSTPPEGNFPPGWNSARVQQLIAEIEAEEANWTAADEAELQAQLKGKTFVQVPDAAVPAIQSLLDEHAGAANQQEGIR